MKITKRLLSMLLAVAMVLSLLPAIAMAEETATTNAVEVADYAALKAAVAGAADGATIKLTANIGINPTVNNTSDNILTINQNITLDLNGYLLRYRMAAANVPIQVSPNYTLTIKDSSASGAGAIDAMLVSGKAGAHLIRNDGTVIVESGNIRQVNPDKVDASIVTGHLIMTWTTGKTIVNGGNFVVLGTGMPVQKTGTGTCTVNGGTFNKTPAFIASGYGTWNNGDGTQTIKKITTVTTRDAFLAAIMTNAVDGDIIRLGTNIVDIRNVSNGWLTTVSKKVTLDLNGFTLDYRLENSGRQPITIAAGGSLTITDNSAAGTGAVTGTLYSTNVGGRHLIENNGTLNIEKGKIAIVKAEGDATAYNSTSCVIFAKAPSTTVITGGNFASATNGTMLYSAGATATYTITGGTYSKEFNTTYMPAYYGLVDNGNGTYTVKRTGVITVSNRDALVAAIGANASDGDIIRLGADMVIRNVSNGWIVNVNKKVTLDLNGKTLTYQLENKDRNPVTVNPGADLTIIDSSADGTGAIKGTMHSANAAGRHLIECYGDLTIEAGTFAIENPDGVAVDSTAVVVFARDAANVTVNDGVFSTVTDGALITIRPGSEETATLVVNEGTFSKKINTAYLPEGLTTADLDGDGWYTLEDACIITWDIEGELIEEIYAYGEMPEYKGETPTKAEDEEYTYEFIGWDCDLEEVAGEMTYVAVFEAIKKQAPTFTITWVVEGVETTETYEVNADPEYKGETPTKAEDADYTYEFAGWSPELAPVTGDATYTAQFTATPKIKKFDFDGATMTLGSNLDMSFYIEPSDLQEGESYYVVITREYADSRADAQFRIEQADWSWHTGYKQYYVTFKGIAAKEMTDSIRLVVYNSKDEAVSNEWVDSVRDYVMRMLTKEEKKTNPNAVDMTMFVEMLNYGAAAQVYFKNYNIEDLANSQLTESQKGYALTEVPMENHVVKGNGYNGTSLTLESQILTKIFFKSTVVNQSMKAVVSFTDHYGNLKTKEIAGSEFTKNPNDPDWFIPITEVAIADYGQLVTVTIYDAEGNEVTSAADSIESYAARNSNGDDLYKAIMAFGIAAKAYFHK